MTWWFHLLVRRVDSLKARCTVFERVVRAGAAVPYAEQGLPLLLQIEHTSGGLDRWSEVVFSTATARRHRGGDLPAVLMSQGALWFSRGIRYRPHGGGRASTIYVSSKLCGEEGEMTWTDSDGYKVCTVILPTYTQPRYTSLDLILPPQ